MNAYKCLNSNIVKTGDYSLVPIRHADIGLIGQWRNEQIDVLRQKLLLTENDQEEYYTNAVKPSFTQEHPSIILFSYLLDGQLIGYGGITNINWISKKAEVSFLLDTSRIKDKIIYRKEFSLFLDLIKKVAFHDMAFHKLFTETYNIRPFHIEILEENEFILEGKLNKRLLIDNKWIDSLIHGYIYHG